MFRVGGVGGAACSRQTVHAGHEGSAPAVLLIPRTRQLDGGAGGQAGQLIGAEVTTCTGAGIT